MSTKCCSSSGDPPLLPVTKYVYKPLYQSWVSHAKKMEQMGAPPRLGKGPHSLAADNEAQLRGRNQTHRFTHHRHNSASGILRKKNHRVLIRWFHRARCGCGAENEFLRTLLRQSGDSIYYFNNQVNECCILCQHFQSVR